MFFTLRSLTSEDPGPTVEDWKRLFLQKVKLTLLRAGLQLAGGVAADSKGNVYVSDLGRNLLLHIDPRGNVFELLQGEAGFQGLALDSRGRLLACQPSKARVIAVDLATKEVTVLADRSRVARLQAPIYLTVDRRDGVYFTDAPNPSLTIDHGALYYISPRGTVTRLLSHLVQPQGVGLSPDESRLFVATSLSANVVVCRRLESAGNPSKHDVLAHSAASARAICWRAAMGLPSIAATAMSFVGPIQPRAACKLLNPEGARLGLIAYERSFAAVLHLRRRRRS